MGTRSAGLLNGERILSLPQLAAALAIVLGIFTLIFGVWTATSVWSFPRFVLAVVMLIYLPGRLLLDGTRLRVKPLEDLTVSLVLGMIVSSFLYWIFAFLTVPYLFRLWPLMATGAYLYRRRKGWSEIGRIHPSWDLSHILLLGVIILSLIPLAALPMYYRNMALLPQGGMTFLSAPRDAVFHLSIANELKQSIPPQAPFLAGQPLGYHYAMDLMAAMFSNSAWLSVPDLTLRFVPTLFLVITVLAIFCFSRAWLGSSYGAVLTAFLVIFGEDLSFIPGLMLGSKEVWSAQFFGVPTTYSLYFLNPMLPALGILFSGLFCLVQFFREKGGVWLILTGVLFASLMEYKVFATAHLVIAMAIAASIYLWLRRDARLLKSLAVTALIAAPLVLYSLFHTEAETRVWMRIAPWPYVPEALEQLGLLNTSLGDPVNALFGGGPVTLVGLATFLLVSLPGYLLGSLGIRVIGIPRMLRALLSPSPSNVLTFFIALFVMLGPIMSLTLTVTPWGYPADSEYNNAVWFYVQSKYVLWILVGELLVVRCRGRRLFWQAIAVTLLVVLSIPSTVQYFDSQMSYELDTLDENELELVGFLEQGCSRGEVVLSRQEVGAPIVATTRCRVPVLNLGIYTHSFASMTELAERRHERDAFWDAWNRQELRTDILGKYEVGYVVTDRRAGDVVPAHPSWTEEGDRSGVRRVSLRKCFDNEDFAVYKVER